MVLRIRWAASAAAGLLTLAVAAAATAQTPPPAPPQMDPKALYAGALKRAQTDPKSRESARAYLAAQDAPMPPNAARLDELLQAKDYQNLFSALTSANAYEAVNLDLNWEQRKLFDGAGLIMALAYVNDLWRMGQAMKAQGGDQLLQSAVAFSLYADALVEVDGARCADAAAPAFRRKQLFEQRPEVWAYAARLPKAARDNITAVSLGYEALTSPVRRDDEVLCQGPTTGSMAEMADGLVALAKEGKQPKQVSRPDVIGKSYEVPRAPPKFLAPAEWKPRQAAARERLADLLIETVAKGAPPAAR
ncbi:hypothetical protein [Phenylobacterium sp.]|uniref:hypothetical protein n=1 Tax=Phenylobacterium sp. TaxID=1871053 RepID=UPI003568612A